MKKIKAKRKPDANGLYSPRTKETITDDYNIYSAWCLHCGRKSMQIVRIGKVQCAYCG